MIKYAKWNAVRIVKAIKEGKDPNESNPKPEPELGDELQGAELDPNDPEVQQFTRPTGQYPPNPTVQDADDEENATSHLAPKSMLNASLHPSGRETPVTPAPIFPSAPSAPADDNEVSPLEPSPHPRKDSIGGGYFPSAPADAPPSTLPETPANLSTHLPPAASPRTSTAGSPPPVPSFPSHPPVNHTKAFQTPTIPTVAPPVPASIPPASASAAAKTKFEADDVAIAAAQKHARWAISALNFEDCDTAVRELRKALEQLGAS